MRRLAAILLTLMLAVSVAPTPASAAAGGEKLESKNVILMSPGKVYQVQMAGKPVQVTLLREYVTPPSEGGDGSIRTRISVNGAVVRDYVFSEVDGVEQGDVFLVKVTASDTLIYQHDLIAEGEIFVSSVVFRFNGKKLVNATKRDSYGSGAGWFKLDRDYASKAGAGKVVTKVGGITNTCQYAKNKMSCKVKLPLPKIAGTLKVGKTLKIKHPKYVTPSSYLWYRCNAKGKNCNGIALNVKKGIAATKKTYQLKKADKGKRIKVCVDYRYEHWGDWVCSKASAKVK